MKLEESLARNESEFNLWECDTEVPDGDLWRRDIHLFSSPRIWGHYKIHRHASVNLNAKCDRMHEIEADRLKARLASVLIDRIDRGDVVPLVDAEMIDRLIETSRPLPVSKRALRLLRFMTKPDFSINKALNLRFEEQLREAVLGWSESTNESEVDFFLDYLVEKELIRRDANWVCARLGGQFICRI